MANNRVTFGSKLGVVLATVGCAVGLGSVWRFPYMLGANGGAAFLLVYILFMIFLGIPVMVTEFFIGRYSRSNTVGSFMELSEITESSTKSNEQIVRETGNVLESHANVGSPEEALSASLNKYGTVNLDYMREITSLFPCERTTYSLSLQ